jgi:amino acid transporter
MADDKERRELVPGLEDDDEELIALGYKPSFRREFTNLSTISFAFSIMGVCSSIATTFNSPLTLGGPSSVVWAWILGSVMCFTLGSSIAEIVSAYPTCGGLYSATAYLTPKKHRAKVGWLVGWLNMLGQIAGVSSTEFGLSGMIWAAVYIGKVCHQLLRIAYAYQKWF